VAVRAGHQGFEFAHPPVMPCKEVSATSAFVGACNWGGLGIRTMGSGHLNLKLSRGRGSGSRGGRGCSNASRLLAQPSCCRAIVGPGRPPALHDEIVNSVLAQRQAVFSGAAHRPTAVARPERHAHGRARSGQGAGSGYPIFAPRIGCWPMGLSGAARGRTLSSGCAAYTRRRKGALWACSRAEARQLSSCHGRGYGPEET
jgi:hypothetical protein